MSVRTDLALEAHDLARKEQKGEIDGIISETKTLDNIKITKVDITTEKASKQLGKSCGTYVTIEAPDICHSIDVYEAVVKMISIVISELTYKTELKSVLVVGLGNRSITPDALGCATVESILVTRKMELFFEDDVISVSAIAPGVLGTTGIETSDIIKGLVEKINPTLVIAVDALAAADISRISHTVQISDTGIQPGAGVGNNRKGLNSTTLGVKVLAIGVPTVIDARTISSDSLLDDSVAFTVTPNDIDIVIEKMSKTVANGINMALHPHFTLREIAEIIS